MLGRVAKRIFDKTYLQDGVELKAVLNGEHESDWLSRLAGFIGFPNRVDDKKKGQSLANLAKNFIGYQGNVSRRKKIINAVTMPLTIALNLLNLPFRLMTNIAKLATEVLPGGLQMLCDEAAVNLTRIATDKTRRPITKGLAFAGVIAARIVGLAFGQIYMVGRAITSPINAVQEAWQTGLRMHDQYGKLIGGLLAGISILITFTTYAVLFPLAIKALSAPIIHFAATHLPNALTSAINTVANALSPGFAAIGKALTPAVNWLANSLSFGIFNVSSITASASPAAIGVFGLTGALVPTAGTKLSSQVDKFQKKWHQSEAEENEVKIVRVQEDPVQSDVSSTDKQVNRRLSSSPSLLPKSDSAGPDILESLELPSQQPVDPRTSGLASNGTVTQFRPAQPSNPIPIIQSQPVPKIRHSV